MKPLAATTGMSIAMSARALWWVRRTKAAPAFDESPTRPMRQGDPGQDDSGPTSAHAHTRHSNTVVTAQSPRNGSDDDPKPDGLDCVNDTSFMQASLASCPACPAHSVDWALQRARTRAIPQGSHDYERSMDYRGRAFAPRRRQAGYRQPYRHSPAAHPRAGAERPPGARRLRPR